jgi:3-hydroxyisobutyrate dehydrogenase-like beta-hydroxyacid dehydrogenase
VAPKKLYEAIVASQAGTVSNLFRELGKRVGEERYDGPTFTVRLLNKDVRLGVEMAEEAGAPPILGRAIDFLNKAALAQGFGGEDTSVMWKSVKNFWKKG